MLKEDNDKRDEILQKDAPLEKRLMLLEQEVKSLKELMPENKILIMVSSGDLDTVLPAFIIAAGALAAQIKVTMFFTFWGINAIRKKRIFSQKSVSEKLMTFMLPNSFKKLPLSKLNMLGIGPLFMKQLMKEHNVVTLEDLIKLNQELGVKMVSCQMTMGIMGVKHEELIEGLEFGGVSSCLQEALNSKVTLYV